MTNDWLLDLSQAQIAMLTGWLYVAQKYIH